MIFSVNKNKFYHLITKVNIVIAIGTLLSYFSVRLYKIFILSKDVTGDESGFLRSFLEFQSKGFYEVNVSGNSTVYNLLSSFFFLFTDNPLLSLRLTSLVFGILTIVLIYFFQKRYFNLSLKLQLLSLITVANILIIGSFMFYGYNDQILSVLMIIFFFSLLKLKKNERFWVSCFYIGSTIALFLSTRILAIAMLPSFFLVILVRFRNLKLNLLNQLKFGLVILISTFFVSMIFNYPSLLENQKMSFHTKGTYKNLNWAQRQYLTAVGQAKDMIPKNQHYTWLEVEEYLSKYGEDSLPKSGIESVLWDLKFTIKEFFKDFVSMYKPYTRTMGFIFVVGSILFFIKLFKEKLTFMKRVFANEIFIFFISYLTLISFIVISTIENRWFLSILIFLPALILSAIPKEFSIFNKKITTENLVVNLQCLSITLMSIPFLMKNLL